jgi:hypothetical protein
VRVVDADPVLGADRLAAEEGRRIRAIYR